MKISEVLTEAGAAPRYYFAYGMLTDPNNMHGAELVGPALLRNFEFELFRFANVNPVPGAHVIGSLWQLDSNLLGQLDQIEGYPTLYDRKTVPVFTPDGHRYEAELYTMTPYTRERMLGTATTQSYVNSLTRGYKNAGIPMDQLSDAFRRDQPQGIKKKRSQAQESQLDEVADQPYRFISPVSTAVAQKSQFQTDSGVKMQVNIIVDQSSGTADVGFYDATDKDNPTIGMTGKGDAFRVFATVGAIVKQFVDRRRPPFLSFAGKTTDPGRIKLYDMIAKNIGRYLPEYKLVDSGFANGDKGYTFKRVAQESVGEVANLNERKMADLYHFTHLEYLEPILDSGAITPQNGWISLTRNSRYNIHGNNQAVKIVIDQAALTNTHKLYPYDWTQDDSQFDPEIDSEEDRELIRSGRRMEAEERTNRPIPLKYIKLIELPNSAKRKYYRQLLVDLQQHNIPFNFALGGPMESWAPRAANGDKGYTFQRVGQLEEDASVVPAQQVLDYVKQIHPEGEFNIDHVITDHPQWTLSTVPVSSLHLFDPEQDDIYDPYNRVQDTNLHHVDRLIPNIASIVQKRPVVIDDQGYVLDGNHRALAALKAGLKNIPVWVPVNTPISEGPTNKAKVTLYTDPNYYGADVDPSAGEGLQVVNLPLNQLVGFEPDDKMKDPKSAANMSKMVGLIKAGQVGQLPPILARKYNSGYQVLDGHHRFHAYQAAGAKTIPAKIVPDSDIRVLDKAPTNENFADGKKPGRKGLAKRMGVPTKASVGKLRSIAKHSTGERARMAHWMANMKSGRAKKTNEEYDPNEKIIRHFMRWVYRRLNIKDDMPRLELDWTKDPGQHNTGSYNYKTNTLYVYMAHRNLIDILRTIAHELQHRKQGAQGRLHGHSPPGSKIEREADGEAGYLVKLYGAQHPNIMQ